MTVEATTASPIKYLLAYYGKDSWTDLILRWNGAGTTWTLYLVGQSEPLYTGPERQFFYAGEPGTGYNFRVETTIDGTLYSKTIITYTTALPAPINLRTTSIGDTACTLSWDPQNKVTKYDVCDVTNSYKVITTVTDPTVTLTGLEPSSRQSYAVRSYYLNDVSRWSSPVTFFTLPPDNIQPGEYVFSANTVYVWREGRPGSTDPGWLPNQSDWYHGDGFEWNDNDGVKTTYFFFGSPNPFGRLSGAVVTRCEVYIDRYTAGGDPGPVLNRLGLHTYQNKPDGEPIPPRATVDAGTLSRGEGAWIEVPTSWAEQLIIGAYAVGVTWGGTPERYELAKNTPYGTSPRTGDVRITVG